jgi:flagellar assembly protein FliH
MAKPQAEARRFLFDQSFDVARKSAKKPKPEDEKPPEPTFNGQQLEEARQQGYKEGRLAGNEEAASSSEAEVARLVAEIAGQLPAVSAAQAEANDRLLHDGATLVATIARKILPALAAQNGLSEVETLLAKCLRTLIDQPKIIVRVGAQHTESISTHLAAAAAASGFDGRFMVEADDAMGPSDCRVSWQGGGLERKAEEIWRQVDAAVAGYLGTQAPACGDASRYAPPAGQGQESITEDGPAAAAPLGNRAADDGGQPNAPAVADGAAMPVKALDLLEER